jgi:hypothetical protein
MHTPHAHPHAAAERKLHFGGAISLLRMSATARLAVAAVLSALIWLLVYFAAT